MYCSQYRSWILKWCGPYTDVLNNPQPYLCPPPYFVHPYFFSHNLDFQNSVKFHKDFTQDGIFLPQYCWHLGMFLHLWPVVVVFHIFLSTKTCFFPKKILTNNYLQKLNIITKTPFLTNKKFHQECCSGMKKKLSGNQKKINFFNQNYFKD